MQNYPIGKEGIPWGEAEKREWLQGQAIKRSYADEVLSKLEAVSASFSQHHYGTLPYDPSPYPLYAFTNLQHDANKPTVLITGGVHGYETSGVQGAIDFLLNHAEAYTQDFNFIIVPCISPWGYETINRWNPETTDPNRAFMPNSAASEASLVMAFVHSLAYSVDVHFDLHETTDTDDSEFRPALAAKMGTEFSHWGIPDGFYTVADSNKPQIAFQQAIINRVKTVTHIAPADDKNQIIAADVVSEGVICYDKKSLFLCGGFTDAAYVTTTEVYPDSPNASPQQCIDAQVAAIKGGLDYLLKQ